jgi:hypothetical protein
MEIMFSIENRSDVFCREGNRELTAKQKVIKKTFSIEFPSMSFVFGDGLSLEMHDFFISEKRFSLIFCSFPLSLIFIVFRGFVPL